MYFLFCFLRVRREIYILILYLILLLMLLKMLMPQNVLINCNHVP